MPNIPQSPLQDGSAATDADLAALLAGKRLVAHSLQPVADVLAALSAEPSPGELAGEARALAAFGRRAGVPVPRRRARRGTAGLTPRLSTKAAAAATTAVLLSGAATAAFAGVLPAPIQRFAHDAFGAPNARSAPSAPQPDHARGKTAPGQFASRAKSKAGAKSHGQGRHPGRHGHGQPGTGQGQPGNGQGSPHAKGQGAGSSGQGQPGTGQGQPGTGQGQPGNGQGQGNPHAKGQRGDPHPQGQQGNPHPRAKPAAHHARPARHGSAMDP
jgi:hypothetical protein